MLAFIVRIKTFLRLNESFSIDTLIPEKREEFDACLQRTVDKAIQSAVDGFFNKGIKLRDLRDFIGMRSLDFIATEIDFTTYKPNEFSTTLRSKRYLETYKRVKAKQMYRQNIRIANRVNRKLEDFYSTARDKIKLYKFASERLNIAINDLSDDDVKNVKDDFYEALHKEALEKEEEKSKKAFDELMAETVQTPSKATRSKKVSKQTNKHGSHLHLPKNVGAEAPSSPDLLGAVSPNKEQVQIQSVFSQMVCDLNNPRKREFRLHPRVSRWSEPNLELIKKFGPPYNSYDNKKLKDMRAYHNLPGIERILSEEQLKDNYSFSYVIKNNTDAKGRGFYTTMKRADSTPQSGIVYVAFNEKSNVVYHAMFVAFSSNEEVPLREIKQNCNRLLDLPEEETTYSAWESNSETLFNYDQDGSIIMEVGKKPKNRVTFIFDSLHQKA